MSNLTLGYLVSLCSLQVCDLLISGARLVTIALRTCNTLGGTHNHSLQPTSLSNRAYVRLSFSETPRNGNQKPCRHKKHVTTNAKRMSEN